MEAAKTIDTSVTLPIELYQAIVKQAQAHGYSVSGEITALLTPLLMETPTRLAQEFAAWEAASDDDWLSMEATLASLDEEAVSPRV
jgi:biotin carboxylase